MGTFLLDVFAFLVAGNLLAWGIAVLWLKGEDLSAFDRPSGERFSSGDKPSAEIADVVASFAGIKDAMKGVPLWKHTGAMRLYMDNVFADRSYEDVSFVPVDCGGVPGEWVLAAGADGRRRTLYIHGGAFTMGSPRSHRPLTTRFSEMTGGAVLAVDYRLMPEHRRRAGIEDCRTAYRWLLAHGPDGPGPAQAIFVAGDSAGGNLTLSLIAWVRDNGLRAPDAAVALSPLTDSTLASPSFRANVHSDALLGPLFERLAKVPLYLMLWFGWIQTRINPRNPVISPVYGDLSKLPPVLVHASELEMVFDDCRRYVNRAQAAGSPVRLQTWNHVMHVWHIFNPALTEARTALDEIDKFLASASPPPGR